ncbi:MAG: EAL domain-containing protein [Desulfosporosinus sp.]|nr:EAL domain-containing protein [Desulfosporosinus sp.]
MDINQELQQPLDELDKTTQLLKRSQIMLKRAQALAHVGNWEIDLATKTIWFSEEACQLYGLKMENHVLSINRMQQFIHIDDRSKIANALEHLIKGEAEYAVDFRVIKASDSEERHMYSVAEVEYDSSGKAIKILGVVQDVTERMLYVQNLENKNKELMTLQEMFTENEQRIRHMAYHDYATNLPNRNLFLDRLKNAITISKHDGTKLIIIFLNIDNFKLVNDSRGHITGDEVLIGTSKRLLECISAKDTVARINGDEFSLLIESVKSESSVSPFLERLISTFKEPFIVNENVIYLTASIGVSIYPDDGDTEEELMNNANTAMHKAKELGKNKYLLFNFKMKEDLWQKINIELLLMKAIKNNEFVLYYQPQYTAGIGKLTLRGFEALIRWVSPEVGFLDPMEFIPIAEETGLITQIGEWVLNTACRTCKKFEAKYNCDLIIAVNISPIQLKRSGFHEMILKAIDTSGLKPTSLELEVTESIFIDNCENITNKLNNLRDLGIGIALDDFGTGYSSLSYLRRLPINLLKIDKSFVQEINSLNPTNDLTESIIALVNKLNIKTMAEGVETLEQLNYLINANCDYLQGYYLGKPEPEELIDSIIIEKYCLLYTPHNSANPI